MVVSFFLGIEHFAIAARDPEKLKDWYVRVLGFRVRTSFDNGPGRPRTYMLQFGEAGPLVEMFPADMTPGNPELPRPRANTEPGLAHVALLVGDFDAAAAHLASEGVPREGEERAAPLGARVQFYRDPEGNLLHILYRPRALP